MTIEVQTPVNGLLSGTVDLTGAKHAYFWLQAESGFIPNPTLTLDGVQRARAVDQDGTLYIYTWQIDQAGIEALVDPINAVSISMTANGAPANYAVCCWAKVTGYSRDAVPRGRVGSVNGVTTAAYTCPSVSQVGDEILCIQHYGAAVGNPQWDAPAVEQYLTLQANNAAKGTASVVASATQLNQNITGAWDRPDGTPRKLLSFAVGEAPQTQVQFTTTKGDLPYTQDEFGQNLRARNTIEVTGPSNPTIEEQDDPWNEGEVGTLLGADLDTVTAVEGKDGINTVAQPIV